MFYHPVLKATRGEGGDLFVSLYKHDAAAEPAICLR